MTFLSASQTLPRPRRAAGVASRSRMYQQRVNPWGNKLIDRVSSAETTGLRSSDEDEEERSVADTDVPDLASSDGERNGTDPDGGEGEMHHRQHSTAMAAQISNGFEDRASTPDILYISDSGGDTEILMSDNDDEEGGVGGAIEEEDAIRHETTFEASIDGGQTAVQSLHHPVPAVPDSPKFAAAPSPKTRHSAPLASPSAGFRNGSAKRSPFKNVPRWSIGWEKRNKVLDFDSLADHEWNFGTQKTEGGPKNAVVGNEQRQRTEPTILASEQQQRRVDREVEESLDSSGGQLPSQQPSTYSSQDFSAIFENLASATEQQGSPPPESPSLGDSLRTIQTPGPHVETRSGINISDITIVKVVARQDTPVGRKYLATGEIWLPLDAFGTSSLRGLCQAYDVYSSRTDRLASLRKRTQKVEEVVPAQTHHQTRIKSTSCIKHK